MDNFIIIAKDIKYEKPKEQKTKSKKAETAWIIKKTNKNDSLFLKVEQLIPMKTRVDSSIKIQKK